MFLYKRRAGSIIFNFAVDNKYANVCCRQKERNGKEPKRGEYSHEIRKTKNLLGKNIGSTKQNTIRITYLCLCMW